MTIYTLKAGVENYAELEIHIQKPLAAGSSEVLYLDKELAALEPLYARFIKKALATYGGRNRNVFLLPGNLVVKLPRNCLGFSDNDWEGSISNSKESYERPGYIQYPRTRLAYQDDVPILFMEYAEFQTSAQLVARYGEEPSWVWGVDCGQVGLTRRGRLVAFDYGVH